MTLLLRSTAMSRVLLVRPGSTDFDEQGRIKGSLDMPLSDRGREQAAQLAQELAAIRLGIIISSPCESARQTAQQIARGRDIKVKVVDDFRNVDHGLWHGKLIEEVRRNQPRVYRTGQETPDDLCPPGGEAICDARQRIGKALRKAVRLGRDEIVAIVVPDPLATVIQGVIGGKDLGNLWKCETDVASWQLIEATVA